MRLAISTSFGQRNRVGVAIPRSIASPQSVFCLDRKGSSRHSIDLTPKVVAGQAWARSFQEHTVEVDGELRRGGQVDVEIGAQVAFLVFVLRAIAVVEVGILDESGVVDEVGLGVVAQTTATTTEAQREDVAGTMITERLCNPVDVGEVIRIVAALEGRQRVGIVAWAEAVVGIGLVESQGVVVGADELRTAHLPVEGVVVGEFDFVAVVLASLGDDIDGTVGTLVSVECSCGGILEHSDALHLFGRDVGDVALNAVDEEQGRRTVEALQAANEEGGLVGGVVAAALQRGQAEHLAEERVADVLCRAAVDVGAGSHRHRALGERLHDAKADVDGCVGIA